MLELNVVQRLGNVKFSSANKVMKRLTTKIIKKECELIHVHILFYNF
jgi:hypothetical protein